MLIASFFGAVNALGISILGEYVVRIYDQVRGRPMYVVDRRVNFGLQSVAGPTDRRLVASTSEEPGGVALIEQVEGLLEEAGHER